MGYEVEFVFEKGGSFKVVLLDDVAPKTCKSFWDMVKDSDFIAEVRHGRFGGEEIYFQSNIEMQEKENNVQPKHGELCFNPDPDWRAICMFYGDKIAKKENPFNLFARISEGLDVAGEIGERIWLKGAEKVTVRAVK
ncbi:MAG: DUF3830 family protein [Dethiobacteria bacterium]|nr:DUF3830 family protein [Bacillota bacterium]